MVSSDLKTLIETFKTPADGWQFFPVEIFNKDGSAYDTYYVWWVHAVCDAIDETSEGLKTVGGPINGRHKWTHASGVKSIPENLRVRMAVFGDRNAWIDFRYKASSGIFVSDALFDAMTEAGFNGFRAKSVWSEV